VNATLKHHLQVTTELILRDRNHPSVVMWSLANEPNTELKISEDYFKLVLYTCMYVCCYFKIFRNVFNHARTMDPTRPLTFACNREYNVDLVVNMIPNCQ